MSRINYVPTESSKDSNFAQPQGHGQVRYSMNLTLGVAGSGVPSTATPSSSSSTTTSTATNRPTRLDRSDSACTTASAPPGMSSSASRSSQRHHQQQAHLHDREACLNILVLGPPQSGKSAFVRMFEQGVLVGDEIDDSEVVPCDAHPYTESSTVEEASVPATPLFNPVKFTVPPGRAWERIVSRLLENKLLSHLVSNPLRQLQRTTHVIVYHLSLANISSLPEGIALMQSQFQRFFSGIPVFIVLTHYSQFVELFLAQPNILAQTFTNYNGEPTLEEGLKFIAKEILSKLKSYTEAKIRMAYTMKDQRHLEHPPSIKTFDEINIYRTFSQTCSLLFIVQSHNMKHQS